MDTLLRALALVCIFAVMLWLELLSRRIADRPDPAARARQHKEGERS